ncbi:helix-turn-helix transcriptional regulator [Halomonas aquamarina]|uniref:Helix-turn-helix transcriptional regulator n=1 Tax=Vreelandella aquamarina TaxID=77097 RepID=A0ACC5VY39_9GAMM|nr:helix-turn-helix transcriptional regulator [Halomonas aquamarina]MBZ5489170.1 helix-turn-helix transcriptional regulator [Halomonas aquamarina]
MHLTPKQCEIVELLAQGHTADQCAETLHRSVATVQRHILLAKDRLHARNTTHLVALAIVQKLIHLMIAICILASATNPDMSAARHRPTPRISASRVVARRFEGLYA